jgi:hypothetical protein
MGGGEYMGGTILGNQKIHRRFHVNDILGNNYFHGLQSGRTGAKFPVSHEFHRSPS